MENKMLEVTELCPHCNTEVEMRWDVERDGFKAYCPYCGKRLMLCDECLHRGNGEFHDDCNYDTKTDSCRFNTGNDELEYIIDCVNEADYEADDNALALLRMLWTAYCLHQNIMRDTARYDGDLQEIWSEALKDKAFPWSCKQYDAFDLWMGAYLS